MEFGGVCRAEAQARADVLLRSAHSRVESGDALFQGFNFAKFADFLHRLFYNLTNPFQILEFNFAECVFEKWAERGTSPSRQVSYGIAQRREHIQRDAA